MAYRLDIPLHWDNSPVRSELESPIRPGMTFEHNGRTWEVEQVTLRTQGKGHNAGVCAHCQIDSTYTGIHWFSEAYVLNRMGIQG